MSEFTASWLNLRESADSTARDQNLIKQISRWSEQYDRISIVDLASGTGNCFRALAPHLTSQQSWNLIDFSLPLILEGRARLSQWAAQHDLSIEMDSDYLKMFRDDREYVAAFEHCDLAAGFKKRSGHVDLVTVSAFLDLVSVEWCMNLVDWCSRFRASLYACLNYDGAIQFTPSHPTDQFILDTLNRDQRCDKGFGPALGSDATSTLAKILSANGYECITAPSPWFLGTNEAMLQRGLISDWNSLPHTDCEGSDSPTSNWLEFRLAAVDRGQSRLKVGHTDLWAWPSS